jgi:hypothetical protein
MSLRVRQVGQAVRGGDRGVDPVHETCALQPSRIGHLAPCGSKISRAVFSWMAYTTIDGDISDFFDGSPSLTKEFLTDRLRGYLLATGHGDLEVRNAVLKWQEYKFQRADRTWDRFRLTPAGLAAVKDLRSRPH